MKYLPNSVELTPYSNDLTDGRVFRSSSNSSPHSPPFLRLFPLFRLQYSYLYISVLKLPFYPDLINRFVVFLSFHFDLNTTQYL